MGTQNMDSLVRITAGRAAGTGYVVQEQHREKQEAAVLYLTILSTLASLSQAGEYGAKMTKALEDWQEASAKQGSAGAATVGMLVASVEIVGMDGQIQQVSAPNPVSLIFWDTLLCSPEHHPIRCTLLCLNGSRHIGTIHWYKRPRRN